MKVNKHSNDWRAAKALIQARIVKTQGMLESAIEMRDVYRWQGRIEALRALIEEVEHTEEIVTPTPLY